MWQNTFLAILALAVVVTALWLVNHRSVISPGGESMTNGSGQAHRVQDGSGSDETSPVGEDDVILLGVIAARTGSASEVNRTLFPAVRVAVDELNQAGGLLGRQIKLIELDNKSTSLGAQAAARQAVGSNVVAVVGCMRSSFSKAVASVLQESGVPMVTPVATNPEVTRVGDYIFRVCFVDSFQGEVLAIFARRDLKADTAAVFVNADRIYSCELAGIFTRYFAQLGGELVWYGEYLDNAADYSELIDAVRPHEPDVIFVPGEERDAGYIIRQARERGINAQFIGPDSWSVRLYHFAGDHAEGGFFTTHWHPRVEIPASLSFVEKYGNRTEMMEQVIYPLAYDAVMLIADAILRCGSTAGADIRDALQATSDFQGVTGTIRFNEFGDPIGKSIVIQRLVGGGIDFVTRIQPEHDISVKE